MSPKHQRIIKPILTVFICFQILAVFIYPNPESLLYSAFQPVLGPYGNFFGLNTTWRFFSPNPGMRLTEYEVYTDPSSGDETQQTNFRYPLPREQEKNIETYSRKLYNSMFIMMMKPDAMGTLLGRKFCEWHPEAKEIAIYTRGREFPTIEKSLLFNAKDITDLGKVNRLHVADVQCREEAE